MFQANAVQSDMLARRQAQVPRHQGTMKCLERVLRGDGLPRSRRRTPAPNPQLQFRQRCAASTRAPSPNCATYSSMRMMADGFDQPTNLRVDVRPRLPIRAGPASYLRSRLLDFNLARVAVMREDRPMVPGPQPCSLGCFSPEGIQHAIVNLTVRR